MKPETKNEKPETVRKPTMRETPEHERPRERLVKVGAANLSEVELLAIIISRGTKGMPVRDIAQELVNRFHSAAEVSRASIEELMLVPGIGKAKACQIVAAFELARRGDDTPCVKERADLSDPKEVARRARSSVKDWRKECFLTFYVDSRNRHIGEAEISVGSLDTTLAHPREGLRAGDPGRCCERHRCSQPSIGRPYALGRRHPAYSPSDRGGEDTGHPAA